MFSKLKSSGKCVPIGMPIGRNTSTDDKNLQEIYFAVSNLADNMDYRIEQRNGQRHFGPPTKWYGETPSQSCEVFIGNIPKDIYEDTLVPLLSTIGTLYQFRLMMDFNGYNRGFGFAKFTSTEEAREACRVLHDFPVAAGKQIVIMKCVNNNSLYIGGIPNMNALDIQNRLIKNTKNVCTISVTVPDHQNRRYVLATYKSHRDTALSRRFLQTTSHVIFETCQQLIVDWGNRHNLTLPVCAAINVEGDFKKYIRNDHLRMLNQSFTG